jgi:hypothetical protein
LTIGNLVGLEKPLEPTLVELLESLGAWSKMKWLFVKFVIKVN